MGTKFTLLHASKKDYNKQKLQDQASVVFYLRKFLTLSVTYIVLHIVHLGLL